MSAPTTRVFLLPAALSLTRLSEEPGQLRTVLYRAWDEYDLALATEQPADHPFVQLAAALSDRDVRRLDDFGGVCETFLCDGEQYPSWRLSRGSNPPSKS